MGLQGAEGADNAVDLGMPGVGDEENAHSSAL
jgi:hypothetical protein